MNDDKPRGSAKLLDAWKHRALTENSVMEIAENLGRSPAKVAAANVFGGLDATGLSVTLNYEGDDVPRCGNDILFWLQWHRRFGGVVVPPRVIIKGTPRPDFLQLQLGFGHVPALNPAVNPAAAELPGNVGGAGGFGG